MYNSHLEDYVINKEESIYKANWKYNRSYRALIAIDNNEKFAGFITYNEIRKSFNLDETATVNDIANKNPLIIYDEGDEYRLYADARNIFVEKPNVHAIPVIDKERNVLDLFTRERAFWRKYYDEKKLHKMEHATNIFQAAFETNRLGLDKISIIEFGVADGNGLVVCEFHAREIKRIYGVDIEIYGFDLGDGLPPENKGHLDMIHIWKPGCFNMNQERLQKRLQVSKLILGDLNNTLKTFISDYNPAPIGAVFVDVDYYSSTLPILEFLKSSDDSFFLPRIYTYFDDIKNYYHFQGEDLAISEFNAKNTDFKISPEKHPQRLKLLHRFKHSLYNKNLIGDTQLPYNCFI